MLNKFQIHARIPGYRQFVCTKVHVEIIIKVYMISFLLRMAKQLLSKSSLNCLKEMSQWN